MERTHGKLRAWFTNGLRGNNTNRNAEFDRRIGAKVIPITRSANTAARSAAKHRTDPQRRQRKLRNRASDFFSNDLARSYNSLAAVFDILKSRAAKDTGMERHTHIFTLACSHHNTIGVTAVIRVHHHILRHINQTAREVSGIRRTKRRISQTLSRTMRGDKIFDDAESFLEG